MSDLERKLEGLMEGRITRKQFIQYGIAAGLSMSAIGGLLAACGPSSSSGSSTPPSKPTGTIIVGNPEPPTSANWDPHLGYGLADQQTWSLTYDTLVQPDATGKLIGRLATKFARTNSTTLHVEIHKGVKFPNGDELTSADVKASFDRLGDPKSGLPFSGLNPPSHVNIIDTYSFDISTDQPYGPLETNLTIQPIISAKDVKDPSIFKQRTNGTGPYDFVSYSQNKVTLEAKPSYFLGAPRSKTIVLQYIGDPDARRNALLSGEIDIFTRSSSVDLDTVKGNSSFYTNNSSPASYGCYNAEFDSALGDVRVRQALAYAIDRATIANNIMKIDKPAASSLVRSNTYFESLQPTFEYNPAKAKQLLADAGFANGLSFSFASANFLPHQQEIDVAVTDKYFKDVGITAKVDRLETGAFRTNWRNYALSYNTWGGTGSDPDTIFIIFQPLIAKILFKWVDPKLGPLYDGQRFVVGDARKAAVNAMAQYLWEQQAQIYIADDVWYTIVSSKVKNYSRAPVVGEALLTQAWKV